MDLPTPQDSPSEDTPPAPREEAPPEETPPAAREEAPREGGPVDASERVVLLDVVRGFALGGVFLSNVYGWFSGRPFLTMERHRELMASRLNAVADYVVTFVVSGKFFTIFSFLFGLGFAVQAMRAEERSASFASHYARRGGVMLLLGVVHIIALWYGDILHFYALTGFALLLFRRRSPKTLFICGLLLTLLANPLVELAATFLPRLLTSPEAAEAASKAREEYMKGVRERGFETLAHGSYFSIAMLNPKLTLDFFLWRPGVISFFGNVLGNFLLGFSAAKIGLFHDVDRNRPILRRMLWWGLVIGVITGGVILGFRILGETHPKLLPEIVPQIVMPMMWSAGMPAMAAFYTASIALLFQREGWRRLLMILAPVGRMAVTSYLSQSFIAIFVFYGIGLGLMRNIGVLSSIALPIGIFCVQIAVSHLWLKRFRFGPVEWLWRSLTYGKAQPMRRPAEPS